MIIRLLIVYVLTALLMAGCTGTEQPEATVKTGWETTGDGLYYYDETGSPAVGWLTVDEERYYFQENGLAVSGWTEIGGERYYFREDYALASGEIRIGEEMYLFDENGLPADGQVLQADGSVKRYEAGRPVTGWREENGVRRYYLSDGTMAVGEMEVDGQLMQFSPHGVPILLVNPWHCVPQDYEPDLVEWDEYYSVDRSCYDDLKRMMADCEAAGLKPMICSGYRSQETQEFLYQRKVTYYLERGYDEESARYYAGQSVAVPGTSEHQLGLAVDIVSTDYYVLDDSQATTLTQQWLMAHCWEYGFILRYPEGTTPLTGIIYEPWHYRYVGTEVSLELRDLGITLEEYLQAVSAAAVG